jgi:hypothetical protein
VTVINGAQSREWLLVKPGADLDELARGLDLIRDKISSPA